jgi:serine phosphatase RsbU (regulator of sigma subunit)
MAVDLFPQVNKDGIPIITNYSPKQYKGHNENWMSVCNKYGVLFVANTNGTILEYDGKQWSQIPTSKKTIVYSLAADTLGNIYAGSYADFGRLVINNKGKFEYQSLATGVDNAVLNSQTFYKTYVSENQEVYFCSPKYIYVYTRGKTISVKLPENSWLSFYLNKTLYISNEDNGILELDKNYKLLPVKGGDFYKKTYIRSMNTLNNNEILIFDGTRFIKFNSKTGTSEVVNNKSSFIQKYLLDKIPYNTCNIFNNHNAWATLNGGLAVVNNNWMNDFILTDSTGLCSSTISSVYYNPMDGILWATTNNGIAKIEYSSPFCLSSSSQNLKGSIYSIKRYNNELFVGTSNGLFKQVFHNTNSDFNVIPQFKDISINVISTVNYQNAERLWIGTGNGLYELYQNHYTLLYKDIFPEVMVPSDYNQNTVYIGAHNGLWTATYQNRKWNFKKTKNTNEDDVVSSVVEDNKGNLWYGSQSNGVYCISPDNKISNFSKKDGLPTSNDIFVMKINTDIVFCTPEGFYFFDFTSKKIKPYVKLGRQFVRNNCNIISGFKGYNNQLWLNIQNRLYLLKSHYNQYAVDSLTFNRLPQLTIYSLYTEPSGITWVGTNEGLYSYNPSKILPKNKYFTLIRQVKINSSDSVIFYGNYYDDKKQLTYSQPTNLIPKLDYKYNNLTFTYAAPYFQDENNIQFSYYLEGFDEQWSNWTSENKAIYTNISEGKYVFKVKARNVYLKESTVAEYSFEISPPWYRTIWAFILYGLFGIGLFVITIKLYTRKLEADKRRLEKIVVERTAEVVQQKDEIEVKNKEIEQKNKDITDSILYAKRIQEAILPPQEITNIKGIEIFIYFRPKDIVSGDFYFMRHIKSSNMLIIAAADCTGHGVPGAFMSMLGASLLNEIVTKPEINHTDLVLNELRNSIIESLNQEGKDQETKDGMDIAFVAYDYANHQLEFSGANNPLYLFRNNELIEYKADKMPVGLYDRKQDMFSRVEVPILNDDIVYIFSDGFADQFGGEKGKKYLYKRFKEFLTSMHHLPMNEQQKLIENESTQWRGKLEQIDDQLVIGIRIRY